MELISDTKSFAQLKFDIKLASGSAGHMRSEYELPWGSSFHSLRQTGTHFRLWIFQPDWSWIHNRERWTWAARRLPYLLPAAGELASADTRVCTLEEVSSIHHQPINVTRKSATFVFPSAGQAWLFWRHPGVWGWSNGFFGGFREDVKYPSHAKMSVKGVGGKYPL